MAFCTECGATVPDGKKFCEQCGTPVGAGAATPPAAVAQPSVPAPTAPPPPPPPVAQVAPPPQYAPQPAYAQSYEPPPPMGKYAVVTTMGWLWTLVVMAIPLVGFVFCLIWAIGSGNQNRRNLSRACLILTVVMLVICIVFSLVFGMAIMAALDEVAGQSGGWGGLLDQLKGLLGQ